LFDNDRRHVRGASNAQEAYQSIFLNIIRPALVELVKRKD